MYEDAMQWLQYMKIEYDQGDRAIEIIEYIKEVLWNDNDMRNS